jgi:hypothetical protein
MMWRGGFGFPAVGLSEQKRHRATPSERKIEKWQPWIKSAGRSIDSRFDLF